MNRLIIHSLPFDGGNWVADSFASQRHIGPFENGDVTATTTVDDVRCYVHVQISDLTDHRLAI